MKNLLQTAGGKMRSISFLVVVFLLGTPLLSLSQSNLATLRQQTVRGVIEMRVTETDSEPLTAFVLKSGKRTLELSSDLDLSDQINQEVEVRGVFTQNGFEVISSKPIRTLPPQPVPQLLDGDHEFEVIPEKHAYSDSNILSTPPPTHYTRGVYGVRFRFQDYDVSAKSVSELEQDFFGSATNVASVKGFFAKQIGYFQIQGSVHPEVIVVPFTKEYCETGNRIYNECTNWLRDHLSGSGINLSGKTLALVFPPLANTNGASAVVGPKGDQSFSGTIWLPLLAGMLNKFVSITAHEIGHNIGLGHAGAIGSDGFFWWVDDRADVMGSAILAGPNIYHRLMMGWYRGTLKTISGPVNGLWVRVMPRDSWVKGPKGVVIQLKNADGSISPDYRFLEWARHQLPYNDLTINPLYNTGSVIRKAPANSVPYSSVSAVLDCQTATPLPNDAPCMPGMVWHEPEYGLTIEYYGSSIIGGMVFRITLTR